MNIEIPENLLKDTILKVLEQRIYYIISDEISADKKVMQDIKETSKILFNQIIKNYNNYDGIKKLIDEEIQRHIQRMAKQLLNTMK